MNIPYHVRDSAVALIRTVEMHTARSMGRIIYFGFPEIEYVLHSLTHGAVVRSLLTRNVPFQVLASLLSNDLKPEADTSLGSTTLFSTHPL